jgi:ABC-type Mn2+/Zn2+ transport system permease subunit
MASLLATMSLSVACAALSVFVVARRWAFIGEGISHSGFGGAGAAWLIMLAAPSLIDQPWLPYTSAAVFCIATALAIGWLSRGNRVSSDTAIGIFLVASLAFGFLAQQIFHHVKGADPYGFTDYLFGRTQGVSGAYAVAAVFVSTAVILTLAALGKEILYYCFDPLMAEASGVRAGFIHYLLMILVALTIVIGMQITGSVLVTALLVLPGATAGLLARGLRTVIAVSIVVALIAAVTGVECNARWRFLPTGHVIVLTLFLEFLAAYTFSKARPALS